MRRRVKRWLAPSSTAIVMVRLVALSARWWRCDQQGRALRSTFTSPGDMAWQRLADRGARVDISCAFTHAVGPDPFGGRVERVDIS
jgi:hypothetical protein